MRVLLVLLFALAAGGASAADLKLLTAGAYKSAALEIVADFEKKTGHKVTIDNDTAGALQKRVADGEYFDVVVIPPIADGARCSATRVDESSAKELARVGVGMAIKQGAPLPDISERRRLQEGAAGGPRHRLHRSGVRRLERHLPRPALPADGHRRPAQAQERAGAGRPGRRAASSTARPTSPSSRAAS